MGLLKKTIPALVLSVLSLSAGAEFRWGASAGINGSTLGWKQDLVETNALVGWSAGITGELMIPGIGFGINTGLGYSMNGAKVNFGQREVWRADGFGNESVQIHTIRLPLNLRFKWTRMQGLEQYIAPFVYGGPVFTFNCGGSNARNLEIPLGTVELQVAGGVELLQRWQVYGGYYWGVSYQTRTKKLDNFSAKPRGWMVGATWFFR